MSFAKMMHALDVPERSTVLISGYNSPEHLAAIMGTVLSNCIFSDIYVTQSPELCMSFVRRLKVQVIVCDTYKRLKEKFLHSRKELVDLGIKAAVLFGEGITP